MGDVKVTCGKIHEYLGMRLDFTTAHVCLVDMRNYIADMVNDFKQVLQHELADTLAGAGLFNPSTGALLGNEAKKKFHTRVAKGLFVCKHA